MSRQRVPTANRQRRQPNRWLRAAFSCVAAWATLAAAPAQMLARPGWAGSGINSDPWWRHAVFYRVGPETIGRPTGYRLHPSDLKGVAARLDALQGLGVDALILPVSAAAQPDPQQPDPQQPGSQQPAGAQPQPPASQPQPDAFDDLIGQASRRGIRVLLTFPASAADVSGAARLWLSRGVAGFYVSSAGTGPVPAAQPQRNGPPSAQEAQATVQALQHAAGSALGARIVITDVNSAADSTAAQTSPPPRLGGAKPASRAAVTSGPQLQVDSRLGSVDTPDASKLRTLLAQTIAQPNLLLDLHPPASSPRTGSALATVLLATHPAALIDSDAGLVLQTAPPPNDDANPPHPMPMAHSLAPAILPLAPSADAIALTGWYRELDALHHGNPTLRYGSVALLNFDAQNALVWAVRPAAGSGPGPAVVVACNLSSTPVTLSLSAAVKGLGLRGSFLRTLLRSDKAMGAQDLGAVTVAPFGVYIGELHR